MENLIPALIVTVVIPILGLAFLVIKLWKLTARIQRKSVWRILSIHVIIVTSEYVLLYAVVKIAQLAALAIAFQIITVGLARGICVDNWVFKFERLKKSKQKAILLLISILAYVNEG